MDQQRLRRVADPRPLDLRVVGDPLRHLEIRILVDVDVAIPRRRVHHRDLGDPLQRLLQPLATSRDDQIDQALLRRQLLQLLVATTGEKRDGRRRQLGCGQRLGDQTREEQHSSSRRCSNRAGPPRSHSSDRAPRRRWSRSGAPRRRRPPRRWGPASSRLRAHFPASSPRSPPRPGRRGPRSRGRPSPSRRYAPPSGSAGRSGPRSGPPLALPPHPRDSPPGAPRRCHRSDLPGLSGRRPWPPCRCARAGATPTSRPRTPRRRIEWLWPCPKG